MTADTLLPLQQTTAPLSVLHSWGRISTESRNEPEQLFIELEWICCFTVGRAETLCPAGPAELLTTTAYAPPPSATAPISFPLPRIEPNGFTSAECPSHPVDRSQSHVLTLRKKETCKKIKKLAIQLRIMF